jgi:hypothetical protein
MHLRKINFEMPKYYNLFAIVARSPVAHEQDEAINNT